MPTETPLGPVVLDIAGTELLPEEVDTLQHPLVGGLIFFRRNYESPQQLCRLIGQVRTVRPDLLLAVDQEGGRVQRFKDGFTRLPPLQSLGDAYRRDPELALQCAEEAGWLMATELLVCGIDISFAPVVDADEAFSSVIGDRAFSADIATVTALAEAYIKGMGDAGMKATLKHFPGHGSVEADSHHELPVDERTFADVFESDMQPFRHLLPIAAAVMPAHILFSAIDPNPVGFSAFWLQKVLRQQLQFTGVIFSDDLSMEGAAVAGDHRDRAEAALAAGCDAVLVCNEPRKANDVLERLSATATAANNRLALMKPHCPQLPGTLEELQQMPRWQRATALLGALVPAS